MIRSYTIRLKPTKRQVSDLLRVLSISCDLYNAALQERRDAWKIARKSISYFDQTKELTELRKLDTDTKWLSANIAREPLRRVSKAFSGFFKGRGYPRWKSINRYHSFVSNCSIEGSIIKLEKLGGFRFKTHRIIKGTIKQAIVSRCGNKWKASVICDIGNAPPKLPVSNAVGIDLGLENFIYCSDGTSINNNPRWLKIEEKRLAKRHRNSKNRLKALNVVRKSYTKIRNCRLNFIHHVSQQLVSNYDLIAYERLKIVNMVRSNLAKSILDAAWGELIRQIVYKAENAGRYAVAVNPRGTSQQCSNCGAVKKKLLSDRWHDCECGTSLHRDHNAAINVLTLGQRVVDVLARAQ